MWMDQADQCFQEEPISQSGELLDFNPGLKQWCHLLSGFTWIYLDLLLGFNFGIFNGSIGNQCKFWRSDCQSTDGFDLQPEGQNRCWKNNGLKWISVWKTRFLLAEKCLLLHLNFVLSKLLINSSLFFSYYINSN